VRRALHEGYRLVRALGVLVDGLGRQELQWPVIPSPAVERSRLPRCWAGSCSSRPIRSREGVGVEAIVVTTFSANVLRNLRTVVVSAPRSSDAVLEVEFSGTRTEWTTCVTIEPSARRSGHARRVWDNSRTSWRTVCY